MRFHSFTISRIFIVSHLFLLFMLIPPISSGQDTTDYSALPDSLHVKQHSPTKATIMSALLPGLGQIYNRKYWKVPVIYAGFGVMTYFIVFNTNEYISYKCAYIEKVNGNTNGNYAELVGKYTEEELKSAREYYRRNLEISLLITTVWYALNILDATVDAHLFTYDVSKDLSFRIQPVIREPVVRNRTYSGIRLSFNF